MSDKKILFVGIGNKFKGDDGFGPVLVERLKDFETRSIFFLQCGEVPENYLNKIVKLHPEVIVFVDTIYTQDASPGEILILDEFHSSFSISTHAGSLKIVIDFLKLQGFKFQAYILGVVPHQVNMNDEISPQVRRAIEEIYNNFQDYLHKFSTDAQDKYQIQKG